MEPINYNLKDKSNYNLDIIKSMPINPNELSIRVTPQEDINQTHSLKSFTLNQNNIKNNNSTLPSNNLQNQLSNSSNSNYSSDYQKNENIEEKFSSDNNLSDSNYNSDENIMSNSNVDIPKKYNYELNDDKDKLTLIKKQNDKIDELFNLLESRDKEINSLQNENNSLYKYKNDYKISAQNNINMTNLLNKYEHALQFGKQELKNTNSELANYKNISNQFIISFAIFLLFKK